MSRPNLNISSIELDYFWALSEILDSAKESIFIMDWWLSPELYLRRPPTFYPQWRLDRLLRRKAQEGVKVYVMVYKEVRRFTLDSDLRGEGLCG
jgi:phosphatidylserine/phosphatidylglycerophosphate/cardiolipin synthase-like enzyme